jgi:hypothetical protein
MRRGIAIVAFVVIVLSGIGVAVGAYRAGERNGIEQGIEQVAQTEGAGSDVQVVRVVGDGYGHGFFPFGLFLFPLFLFGTIFLVGALVRRSRGPWHGGPWGDHEARSRFEDRARAWHQHEHGQTPDHPEGGPAPGTATV